MFVPTFHNADNDVLNSITLKLGECSIEPKDGSKSRLAKQIFENLYLPMKWKLRNVKCC